MNERRLPGSLGKGLVERSLHGENRKERGCRRRREGCWGSSSTGLGMMRIQIERRNKKENYEDW